MPARKDQQVWTEERVETLKRLWRTPGWSAATIARDLGLPRNAVIGKAYRLKLSGNDPQHIPIRGPAPKPFRSDSNRPPVASVPRAPKLTPDQIAVIIEGESAAHRIPLTELTPNSCRWPIGNPSKPTFGFCGLQITEGSPYCPEHSARAFTPSQEPMRRMRV